MLGLLRKDLLNLSGQLRIYLFFPLMAVLFCIWQENFSFAQITMSILIIFVPLSAFAYDEMSDFNTYAMTLPITKKQIVVTKYLLSSFITIMVIAMAILIGMLVSIFSEVKVTDWQEYCSIVIVVALVMNFLNCIMLPIMFKYGSEKGRIMMMVLFFGIGGLGYVISSMGFPIPDLSVLDTLSPIVLILLAGAVALVLELISIQISLAIMNKKEF